MKYKSEAKILPKQKTKLYKLVSNKNGIPQNFVDGSEQLEEYFRNIKKNEKEEQYRFKSNNEPH